MKAIDLLREQTARLLAGRTPAEGRIRASIRLRKAITAALRRLKTIRTCTHEATLNAVLEELRNAGLLVVTRQGGSHACMRCCLSFRVQRQAKAVHPRPVPAVQGCRKPTFGGETTPPRNAGETEQPGRSGSGKERGSVLPKHLNRPLSSGNVNVGQQHRRRCHLRRRLYERP
jgi:hypothetical protein